MPPARREPPKNLADTLPFGGSVDNKEKRDWRLSLSPNPFVHKFVVTIHRFVHRQSFISYYTSSIKTCIAASPLR